MQEPRRAHCGRQGTLSLDHLMRRARGAGDRAEKAVLVCRTCHGSNRTRDMISWLAGRGGFPPLMLLRRYLKLAFAIGAEEDRLGLPMAALDERKCASMEATSRSIFPIFMNSSFRRQEWPNDA